LHAVADVASRQDLSVIYGGIAITTRFRFLSATNSFAFDLRVQGRKPLGIDLPSMVRVPILVKYGHALFPARQAILRIVPHADGVFDSIAMAPACGQFVTNAAEPRYGCGKSKPEAGRGIFHSANSVMKRSRSLRLPLYERSAPCEGLMARRSEFKENAVRGRRARRRNCC